MPTMSVSCRHCLLVTRRVSLGVAIFQMPKARQVLGWGGNSREMSSGCSRAAARLTGFCSGASYLPSAAGSGRGTVRTGRSWASIHPGRDRVVGYGQAGWPGAGNGCRATHGNAAWRWPATRQRHRPPPVPGSVVDGARSPACGSGHCARQKCTLAVTKHTAINGYEGLFNLF